MFIDEDLIDHVQTSTTLQIESLVLAEWNLNDYENIKTYGNYRYRKNSQSPVLTKFLQLPSQYSDNDELVDNDPNTGYYTNALKSSNLDNILIDDNGASLISTEPETDRFLYYPLKDCFGQFRPRSGINKPLFIRGKYYIDNIKSARRPRYYMPSRFDTFKYWNSFRKERAPSSNMVTQIYPPRSVEKIVYERGISYLPKINQYAGYPIDDVAPFVVYENEVAANRVVIKLQTNLAEEQGKKYIQNRSNKQHIDPLTNRSESSIPVRWKIQYLDSDNNWIDAISFNEDSKRSNGSDIIDWDGHVEVYYGIIPPSRFKETLNFVAYLDSIELLPLSGIEGEAYVIGATETDRGSLYIWNSKFGLFKEYTLEYGFSLLETDDTKRLGTVRKLTDMPYFESIDKRIYRDFIYMKGLRAVVESMISPNSTFDLIEMSPRLKADISDYVLTYETNKVINRSVFEGLPVGGLSSTNGQISLMNYDGAFNQNNKDSIIYNQLKPNVKFEFYETILNVDGYDKFIPIKTLYSESFPVAIGGQKDLQIPLKDFYFRLETTKAPSLMITNTTLTNAIATLLDNIGFSNYLFKFIDSKEDVVIPYFFIEPDVSVAEVLQRLAISTQTSMFFDEYNNFVLMSKEYLLPNTTLERDTDYYLYGNKVDVNTDTIINSGSLFNDLKSASASIYSNNIALPNIMSIDAQETNIVNSGQIVYTTRYVQRERASLNQAFVLDQDINYVYKPSVLWEVAAQGLSKTVNEKQKTGNYTLGAVALNSDLTADIPYVDSNFEIQNNILSVGENIYWLPRFQGYLCANGEIIRYDAVEYIITAPKVTRYGVRYAGTNTFFERDPNQSIKPRQPIKKPNANQTTTLQLFDVVDLLTKQIIATYASKQAAERRVKELFDNLSVTTNLRSGVENRVWITSNQEYQKYFSTIPFNGKMYPTGNIRIYVQPEYKEYDDANYNGLLGPEQGVVFNPDKPVKAHGRGQFNTKIVAHSAGLPAYWSNNNNLGGVKMESKYLFSTKPVEDINPPAIIREPSQIQLNTYITNAAKDKLKAEGSVRGGTLANFLRENYPTDEQIKNKAYTSGVLQSSALVFTGPVTELSSGSVSYRDFISYVSKPLESGYNHIGTRMRVIGKIEGNNNKVATPQNALTYYTVSPTSTAQDSLITGGGGGLAFWFNKKYNFGYFFEIVSLTGDNLDRYNKDGTEIHNILFYKLMPGNDSGLKTIPHKLWGGLTQIFADEGKFVGQDKVVDQGITTVYDLAVEWQQIAGNVYRFYLYLNDKLIATVDDNVPSLGLFNNIALFTRGSSKCMFENIYALKSDESSNPKESTRLLDRVQGEIKDSLITQSQSLRRYAIPSIVNATFLSSIYPDKSPKFRIYYEEFGTIFRECAYFNIKYDQAYPALIAKVAPTFNKEKAYSVSGFKSGAYGAEFLIFNTTDRAIVLDETSGNYLKIYGVTFTQNTTNTLTVDDYFNKIANFSDPEEITTGNVYKSPVTADKIYNDIKLSRSKYGEKSFSLNSDYIQDDDTAKDLMSWLISKTLKPRKIFHIETFATQHLQLGDILTINYTLPDGDLLVETDKRFVVSEIFYSRSANDLRNRLTLVEV